MKNIILIYFFIINLVGFSLVFVDKRRAINHEWRIKESVLIFISIIGGSIGSYIGMYLFRHKTKHLKFTLGIPIIFLFQVYITIKLFF